ncbi:hypothetical protein E2C01_014302 [Portunus trituberculatus]|uniref:Uncharacterized protein n=1 Tax=Portunus trituberculatus TaxID=210409 RepID=A0A5B7DJQ7_PORTR|nr:hypothetical protein [Portunus trituberculatus]
MRRQVRGGLVGVAPPTHPPTQQEAGTTCPLSGLFPPFPLLPRSPTNLPPGTLLPACLASPLIGPPSHQDHLRCLPRWAWLCCLRGLQDSRLPQGLFPDVPAAAAAAAAAAASWESLETREEDCVGAGLRLRLGSGESIMPWGEESLSPESAPESEEHMDHRFLRFSEFLRRRSKYSLHCRATWSSAASTSPHSREFGADSSSESSPPCVPESGGNGAGGVGGGRLAGFVSGQGGAAAGGVALEAAVVAGGGGGVTAAGTEAGGGVRGDVVEGGVGECQGEAGSPGKRHHVAVLPHVLGGGGALGVLLPQSRLPTLQQVLDALLHSGDGAPRPAASHTQVFTALVHGAAVRQFALRHHQGVEVREFAGGGRQVTLAGPELTQRDVRYDPPRPRPRQLVLPGPHHAALACHTCNTPTQTPINPRITNTPHVTG